MLKLLDAADWCFARAEDVSLSKPWREEKCNNKQESNAGYSLLRLMLPYIDRHAGSDNENEDEDNHPGAARLLVFLGLHHLLQTLLHLRHSLIHVVVYTIHDGALFDHELIQVLEDLCQFLSALCYVLFLHHLMTNLLNFLFSALCLLLHHVHSALLSLVESLRVSSSTDRYCFNEIVVSVCSLHMMWKWKHHVHTAQLLEELLLLLTIGH